MLKKIIFHLFILITIIGCGGSGNSSTTIESISQTSETIVLPSHTTMEIPKKMEPTDTLLTYYSDKSYAYETMQSQILNHQKEANKIDLNRKLVEKVLPQIILACEEVSVGDDCIIPKGQLHFYLNDAERIEFKKAYSQLKIEFNTTTPLFFGETLLQQYNVNDYEFRTDMLEIYTALLGKAYTTFYGQKLTKQTYTLYWSTNNHDIHSVFETDSNVSTHTMTIDYGITDNNETTVHAYEQSKNFEYNSLFRDYFTLIQHHDMDNSYTYRQYSNTNDTFVQATFSDQNGSNISTNQNTNIITFFDNSGNELGQYGCAWSDECDINDKLTWSISSELEQNASLLDQKFQINAHYLHITEALEDGEYFLLPPYVDMATLTNAQIIQQSIGTLISLHQEVQGVLYNKDYVTRVNELKIAQVDHYRLITD